MEPSEETRTDRARRLRRDRTRAEAELWRVLRNRRLGGFKFRRQLPIDRYFADFACVEARLVIELDGSQHGEQADYDARRTEALENAGYTVLRFWNRQVFEGLEGVIRTISQALEIARP